MTAGRRSAARACNRCPRRIAGGGWWRSCRGCARARAPSPALRRAFPSVILLPGIGLVAWGQSKSEARVTAEFYGAAIGVMRGAERVSRYTALDRQEAFDIEYWLLEDAKLKRLPPGLPLDRTVAVVVGAGSGIGRALVREIGRASCRERVEISVVAVSLKKKS